MNEFATDYAPGLPERLPEGERLLWQGKPQWFSLAVQVFHVRSVAIYFAVLMVWRGSQGFAEHGGIFKAAVAALEMLPVALAAVGVLSVLAWWSARATIYTITSRRVVMQFGIALPMTINLPFTRIDAAELTMRRDGTGDIPLKLAGKDYFAFAVLWPHARPWRVNRPEPMLRSVPNARQVAQVLAYAMSAACGQPGQSIAEAAPTAPGAPTRPLAAAMG